MLTAIYAGLLTILFVALSFRVIGVRRSAKIGLGDGGDILLRRRIRVHGNFSEYVPLALVLMMLAESQGHSTAIIHFIGSSLIVGRLLHAYGTGREPDLFPMRVFGVVLTMVALMTGALINLGLGSLVASLLT